MKYKVALLAPLLAFFAFSSPAIAEDDNQSPAPNMSQPSDHPGIPDPEKNMGKDRGEFEHHINEHGENGFEAIQFILIGAALVIALLLAYNAGKRNKKKKDQE
jgi:hypothetical protein